MASKTPTIDLTVTAGVADWIRIDGSQPIIAGKPLSGPIQIEYCTSQPALTDLGMPVDQYEPFSISVATGDQVWAKSANKQPQRVVVFQRAAS